LEELHRLYGDRAEFLAVYVREAHPIDGWRMASNDRAGIAIAQPRSDQERLAVAQRCCQALKVSMPLLVDEIDDRVGHAYSGMPDRLYIIDRAGRVVYKAGRGPFGFKPRELEQSLIMLLLDQETRTTSGFHAEPSRPGAVRRRPPRRIAASVQPSFGCIGWHVPTEVKGTSNQAEPRPSGSGSRQATRRIADNG
jgi:hypothetical protein